MKLKQGIMIFGSIVLIFCIFTIMPTAYGYGTSFGTATVVSTGTYNETINSNAFYKINCAAGDNLQVTTTPSGDVDVNLALYNAVNHSEGDYLALSTLGSGQVDQCQVTCEMSGYYYIVVIKDTSGDISFTMSITKPAGVPGFELLYILFGLISLIGLILLKKKL